MKGSSLYFWLSAKTEFTDSTLFLASVSCLSSPCTTSFQCVQREWVYVHRATMKFAVHFSHPGYQPEVHCYSEKLTKLHLIRVVTCMSTKVVENCLCILSCLGEIIGEVIDCVCIFIIIPLLLFVRSSDPLFVRLNSFQEAHCGGHSLQGKCSCFSLFHHKGW